MAKPAGKSIKDFVVAHDPTYEIESTEVIFTRPLPANTRRFIITAAQNATPLHEDWWAVLQMMSQELKAELLVIPLRYKNPTSQWSGSQQNAEHWAAAARPFLWNTRHLLGPNLMILGDIKIQPTASSPLVGAEALSLQASGIVGHTKLQMRSVATPSNRMAKVLTTTGACTVSNYTDSRSGSIGAFHHSLSAVLVEIDGRQFHLRHVHYSVNLRSCTDLGTRYTATGSSAAPRPKAIVFGDTHVDAIDPDVEQGTFGKGGMVSVLKPEYLIWHDLLDAYSCNPHHIGNPFTAVAKARTGMDRVEAEVSRAIEFVAKRNPKNCTSIIVGSNHNDMLRRWIISNDWRNDPINAKFYLSTALAMVDGVSLTRSGVTYPDPFAYWFRDAKIPNTRVLDEDESFMLCGVELGMHGDTGPNGARGSISNLRRIGVKSIIGHSHSPGIDEGAYQVGTSTGLRLEYNHGPSSWLNCHAILHADGKRQLVMLVDGKWCL